MGCNLGVQAQVFCTVSNEVATDDVTGKSSNNVHYLAVI